MVRDVDPAWQHGVDVDGKKSKIKCNYCGKVVTGGITRLKEHLAHKTGNVAKCTKVSPELKKEMQAFLNAGKQKKVVTEKRREAEYEACREEVYGPREVLDSDDDDDDGESDVERARRESMRSYNEEEERRRMIYESASRGGQYEKGGGSGGNGMLRRMFSQKQTRRPPDWLESGESPTQQARRPEVVGPIDPAAYRSPSAKQPSIAKALSGKMGYARNRLVRAVGKFFFDGAIAPNKATSPYLKTMLDAAAEHGPGIKPPTPYEIGHYCVEEEYKETVDWVNTFKRIWRERGCTLMCDGWTTVTRRSLLNFLVYSSLGTVFIKSVDATEYVKDATYLNKLFNEVIEDIGEECVVQIITDNDASMKKAGMILMQQRPNIFWSPCAAHCLDLMIEDIAKRKMIKGVILKAKKITNFIYQSNRLIAMMKKYTDNHELLRPGITRFATHFIALESLYKYRGGLHQLFTSQEWLESKWGKKPTPQVKQVVKIVQSKRYWPFVGETLKVLEPLIKVLRLADGDDKPTMGFLYEAVARAKLAIQANCKYYKAYWKIIDKRWENQLHHDLHAAGKESHTAFLTIVTFKYC